MQRSILSFLPNPCAVQSVKSEKPSHNLALAMLLSLNACTTAWQDSGRFYQTRSTRLAVASTAPATVYINGQNSGLTPLMAPLEYQEEARKLNRKVSYWVTQPGWSLLLSLASLGLYIPLSLIPVDTETKIESTGAFKDNRFELHVIADGYDDWSQEVVCTGQEGVSVDARLTKGKGGVKRH